MNKTQELYKKAKDLIPGGTQLLSKRPEMHHPEMWPAYYKRAEGCSVWDMDDKHYYDMSYMGIGACILGYADPDVNIAVKKVIDAGSMTTLNPPEEVELAQVLCRLHPWAEMARYARTGGEAMSIAVRIARAKQDKDLVLFCGYHGWHDWYLSVNLADDKALEGHLLPGLKPKGVPKGLKNTMFPFEYNDIETFLRLINRYKDRIAAVVMEPIRNYYPKDGFLETIREETEKLSIVLIFDEITAGWRLITGGAHLKFNICPDIAVFAKGISNGYPMAAVIGKKDVMQSAQETFISSTYWTERIGPQAALATIKKMLEKNVPDYLCEIGARVKNAWIKLGETHDLKIKVSGMDPLAHFSFIYDNALELKTLFTQFMLDKGFLAACAFYASYAHKNDHIDKYLSVIDEAFSFISKAIADGTVKDSLKGPVSHSGFKRLN